LELHGTQSAPTVVVYSEPRVERVVVHRPARLVALFSLRNLRYRLRGMGFCVLGVECFVARPVFVTSRPMSHAGRAEWLM
jgi:hypothetical protein